ncbi:aromatic ring-hydroxylating dioxygenase subunit alpha [Phenylobacterium montanum]|uniref:Rieske 2Fe-2S domain-containing protein n=1 Tax=Phenylobacterium montanum TaxID=2823693 RepID=A0A975FW37_9CAUL|nr:aromatic ring-hydroxylating dioxygenase subunit alpha [Caulobacter sp. S6]QUD85932.1 Rieske 2Fe-2S domain-containing protein [Caulobacter sp. S6]
MGVNDLPTDCWFMAAWSAEVGAALLRRRLCGEPILLYRLEDGSVAALEDRCPHRFAPLSRGERIGDTVQCGYHGLTFDRTGACIRNPFSEHIPKGARVRTWPTHERDGIVWLWIGGAEAADPATIPNFGMLMVDGTAPITGYTPMAANFEFGVDNLMDLSHIEFVHKGSFAGAGVIFAGNHCIRQDGETLHSNWWMPDVPAPSHTTGRYPPDMRTDHWLDMRWNVPASMYLQIGAAPVGQPREAGVIVHQAHILTPETADTAHYFWATTRAGDFVSQEADHFLEQLMRQAFDQEDKPTIEAAYANLIGAGFWDRRPIFLGVDRGAAEARRILIERRTERTANPSTPAAVEAGPARAR